MVAYDGFRMHISSRKGSQIVYKNANQLVIAPRWQQYVKCISKYLERCRSTGQELPITSFDGLSAEQNIELYSLLRNKLENPLFSIKFETAAKTLCENQENYVKLSIPNQCRILLQILNLFANNAAGANLKLLNGKANIGIISTSKNLDNYTGHTFTLIHQSITGFFEQEVDLLTGE